MPITKSEKTAMEDHLRGMTTATPVPALGSFTQAPRLLPENVYLGSDLKPTYVPRDGGVLDKTNAAFMRDGLSSISRYTIGSWRSPQGVLSDWSSAVAFNSLLGSITDSEIETERINNPKFNPRGEFKDGLEFFDNALPKFHKDLLIDRGFEPATLKGLEKDEAHKRIAWELSMADIETELADDTPDKASYWVSGAANLAASIILDPTNYVTFGAGVAAKSIGKTAISKGISSAIQKSTAKSLIGKAAMTRIPGSFASAMDHFAVKQFMVNVAANPVQAVSTQIAYEEFIAGMDKDPSEAQGQRGAVVGMSILFPAALYGTTMAVVKAATRLLNVPPAVANNINTSAAAPNIAGQAQGQAINTVPLNTTVVPPTGPLNNLPPSVVAGPGLIPQIQTMSEKMGKLFKNPTLFMKSWASVAAWDRYALVDMTPDKFLNFLDKAPTLGEVQRWFDDAEVRLSQSEGTANRTRGPRSKYPWKFADIPRWAKRPSPLKVRADPNSNVLVEVDFPSPVERLLYILPTLRAKGRGRVRLLESWDALRKIFPGMSDEVILQEALKMRESVKTDAVNAHKNGFFSIISNPAAPSASNTIPIPRNARRKIPVDYNNPYTVVSGAMDRLKAAQDERALELQGNRQTLEFDGVAQGRVSALDSKISRANRILNAVLASKDGIRADSEVGMLLGSKIASTRGVVLTPDKAYEVLSRAVQDINNEGWLARGFNTLYRKAAVYLGQSIGLFSSGVQRVISSEHPIISRLGRLIAEDGLMVDAVKPNGDSLGVPSLYLSKFNTMSAASSIKSMTRKVFDSHAVTADERNHVVQEALFHVLSGDVNAGSFGPSMPVMPSATMFGNYIPSRASKLSKAAQELAVGLKDYFDREALRAIDAHVFRDGEFDYFPVYIKQESKSKATEMIDGFVDYLKTMFTMDDASSLHKGTLVSSGILDPDGKLPRISSNDRRDVPKTVADLDRNGEIPTVIYDEAEITRMTQRHVPSEKVREFGAWAESLRSKTFRELLDIRDQVITAFAKLGQQGITMAQITDYRNAVRLIDSMSARTVRESKKLGKTISEYDMYRYHLTSTERNLDGFYSSGLYRDAERAIKRRLGHFEIGQKDGGTIESQIDHGSNVKIERDAWLTPGLSKHVDWEIENIIDGYAAKMGMRTRERELANALVKWWTGEDRRDIELEDVFDSFKAMLLKQEDDDFARKEISLAFDIIKDKHNIVMGRKALDLSDTNQAWMLETATNLARSSVSARSAAMTAAIEIPTLLVSSFQNGGFREFMDAVAGIFKAFRSKEDLEGLIWAAQDMHSQTSRMMADMTDDARVSRSWYEGAVGNPIKGTLAAAKSTGSSVENAKRTAVAASHGLAVMASEFGLEHFAVRMAAGGAATAAKRKFIRNANKLEKLAGLMSTTSFAGLDNAASERLMRGLMRQAGISQQYQLYEIMRMNQAGILTPSFWNSMRTVDKLIPDAVFGKSSVLDLDRMMRLTGPDEIQSVELLTAFITDTVKNSVILPGPWAQAMGNSAWHKLMVAFTSFSREFFNRFVVDQMGNKNMGFALTILPTLVVGQMLWNMASSVMYRGKSIEDIEREIEEEPVAFFVDTVSRMDLAGAMSQYARIGMDLLNRGNTTSATPYPLTFAGRIGSSIGNMLQAPFSDSKEISTLDISRSTAAIPVWNAWWMNLIAAGTGYKGAAGWLTGEKYNE